MKQPIETKMIIRQVIATVIVLWSTAAGAAALPVSLDKLAGTTLIDSLQGQMPPDYFYHYQKNADGTESLKLTAFQKITCAFSIFSEKYTPGQLSVEVTGRRYSDLVKSECGLNLGFWHLDGRVCSTAMQTHDTRGLDLIVSEQGNVGPARVVFELPERRCKQCGKLFDACQGYVVLRALPPPEEADIKKLGMEIRKLELSSAFPLELCGQYSSQDEYNLDKIKPYCDARQAWQIKHRELLSRCPKTNQCDGRAALQSPALKEDGDDRYDTLDELKVLNPAFEVTRIVSWPFYQRDIYPDYAYEAYFNQHVTSAFAVGKAIFATDDDHFLVRYNPVKAGWDYIYDATPWQKSHPAVKRFAEDASAVVYRGGKIRKLYDWSEVAPPADASYQGCLAAKKYAVTGDGKVYWIGNLGKKLYVGNMDFSDARELAMVLPRELKNIELTSLRSIYASPGDQRLLLEYSAKQKYNDITVLLELDPATGQTMLKLPLLPLRYFLDDAGNSWVFTADHDYLINPGAGLPLQLLTMDKKPASAGKFPVPAVKCDDMLRSFLAKSLRLGAFACGPTANEDRFLFYNMADPAGSLMLYGFNAGDVKLAPEGGALLFTMPDGWYRVTPKNIPPMPRPEVKAASPSAPDIKSVILSVEAETPALFDARWAADDGEAVLIVEVKKNCTNAELTVNLALPPNPKRYELEFSANPQLNLANGLTAAVTKKDGTGAPLYLADDHTILADDQVKSIRLLATCDRAPQQIILKAIHKK